MVIDEAMIRHVARLARLELTPPEINAHMQELDGILLHTPCRDPALGSMGS